MVSVPAEIPVTIPEVLTVVRAGLALLQTPPASVEVKGVEVPVQTLAAPERVPVIAWD